MNRQRFLRVGAIIAVAGATGFVMQSQGEPEAPVEAASTVAAPKLAAATPALQLRSVELAAGDLTSPDAGAALTRFPSSSTDRISPAPSVRPTLAAAALSPVANTAALDNPPAEVAADSVACTVDMAVIAQPGAVVDLGLLAPCHIAERVLIRHGGLVVTGVTSAAGTLIASIPALQSPAEITLTFPDGEIASASVAVEDIGRFDRFAVQWMESDAFQLHAYERGATDGDGGHISSANPRKASATGAFLSLIGDSQAPRPLLAEVFTWPADTAALSGEVALTIEAAVTPETCNREILGETLQLTAGRLVVRDLTMSMPGCDAIGEFVSLQNPLAAEKLASN